MDCGDVRNRKIDLHPAGRTRCSQILPNHNQDASVTIATETVHLWMIQTLDNLRVQDGFKELLVTCDIGRFNLHTFESLKESWTRNRRVARSFLRRRVSLMMFHLRHFFSRRSRDSNHECACAC